MPIMKASKPALTNLASIFILIFVCLACYSNTFHCSFHLDDIDSITDNKIMQGPCDIKAIWEFWPTRFVTYLSFFLNYFFNGLDVVGYHIVNMTIHAGASIFAWWLALLIFASPALKNDRIKYDGAAIALFVGLVFAAHPIQTQAVTYIVQRAASMATLFYLASVALYAKSRLSISPRQSSFCYVASFAAAVIAMLTKEIAVTIPVVIVLLEYSFLKGDKKMDWKSLAPFLLLLLFIPTTLFSARFMDFRRLHLANESAPQIPLLQYLFTEFRVLVTYIRLLFVPTSLNLDYDYRWATSIYEKSSLVCLASLMAILAAAIAIFKKYRVISFSIFWFFITLSLESSFIPIRDPIFEHRLYLTMFGYGLFLAAGLYYLIGQKNMKLAAGIMIVVIAVYAGLSFNRNLVWKDDLTLWSDVAKKSPKKSRPYFMIGMYFDKNGEFDKAILEYTKAIALDGRKNPVIYNNRGLAYGDKGSHDMAIMDFNESIKIDPKRDIAYCNRGSSYQKIGDLERAMSDYNKAIELNPDNVDAYSSRAEVYMIKKEFDKARRDLRKAAVLGNKVPKEYLEKLKKASK